MDFCVRGRDLFARNALSVAQCFEIISEGASLFLKKNCFHDVFLQFLQLTLFGMGGDTFIPLSFLDQILSAEFFQKFPDFIEGEN